MPTICLDGPCMDIPICLDAPHMFGCLLYIHNTKKACFVRLRGCLYAPIHLYAPICLDAPCALGCPHMFGCTHCMFGCPHIFGWLPVCLDALHIFECPLYVLIPQYGLMHPLYVWMPLPVCLGTPMFGCPLNMCGHSHMFGCPCVCLEDVWMSAVHIQHKESMLCQTEGVSMCTPYIWMPSYVWMSLIPLDAPICLAASKHTGGQPNI